MSVDHNRIKVSDLEINQPNKILATNNIGELEFSDVNNIKIDSYNDLDYTLSGKSLDARQGKVLKNLIDNINILLASDNVNLNTLQELVDAIEVVQISLSNILVNDLTSGGTSKALTAEMGKLLQNNKVDKATGERLINAAEITKLSSLSNVTTTTTKTILSTVLTAQNVTGFVTYINGLNPVLAVGANEIIEYQLSDTGRVFKLLLRGRSFGNGQPAIGVANVVEITEFLNKDITLSNYPSTRNDGIIPTNKVLSVNSAGKLGLYTMAIMPAPYLNYTTLEKQLPSQTFNIFLHGDFFTPSMTVAIAGQTINSVTFKNSSLVMINITTGAAEGLFAITLNNGSTAVYANALLVILGTVYTPTAANITVTAGALEIDSDSFIKPVGLGTNSLLNLDYVIPAGKNFRVAGRVTRSPYSINEIENNNNDYVILSTLNGVWKYKIMNSVYGIIANNINYFQASTGSTRTGYYDNIVGLNWYVQRIGTTVTVWVNNSLRHTFTDPSTEDLKISMGVRSYDWTIKYIDLYQ